MELLKNQEFDFLVTDGYMGDINGFDLAREAMSLQPLMKRVLISGFYKDNEVVRRLFSRLYEKPVNVDELLKYLRQ